MMGVNVSAVMVGEKRDGLLGRMLGGPTAQVTITAPPLPAGVHDDDLQTVRLCAGRALRDTAGRPKNLLTRRGRDGTIIVTATVNRPAVTDPREFERIVAAAWPEFAR